MKKFIEEFKKFALRGNVIDLAVGVIIGGAFTSIVNGVSNDFIKPLLAWIMGTKPEEILICEAQWSWSLATSDFVTTVINFLIIAFCVFLFVKAMAKIMPKKEEPPKKQDRLCPYCKMVVHDEAVKCGHCGSEI